MASTLIITNDFPPRIGGIESFVSDICELLDFDVVVYASGPPSGAGSDGDRRYPVIRDGSLLLPTRRLADRTADVLRRCGATRVIFGAAAPLGLLAPRLRRAGAQRIIALTHGHETWWAALPGSRQLLRRIGDGCDHLTTISRYTSARVGRALSASARARLLRLPPPVDTTRFVPAQRNRRHSSRSIAVGRFVPQKGLSTLLRAWRLVLEERAASGAGELILVGDGPDRPRLTSMISDLDLRGTVRMAGAMPRAEVITALQQADLFVLPVRTRLGGLNPEGLGLAALEAAACGLPVIIGDSGGAPETVRHGKTGFVVDPRDPVDLARKITTLLRDRELAVTMGAAGRSMVEKHFGRARAGALLRRALEL
ncbi:MAG TPA: glycosyltransferase family 4 protein [Propionibacteriaceae bacterium]|nr:glycosyltransferase family 4 protein [Propionibacteriaceae bacterium]